MRMENNVYFDALLIYHLTEDDVVLQRCLMVHNCFSKLLPYGWE